MFLIFLVEGQSDKILLEAIIPNLIPSDKNIELKFTIFSGKHDLLNNMKLFIDQWKKPNSLFIILCDQDKENCLLLKEKINNILINSNKKFLVRIACKELESFYLAI
jgi:hypothetical protein